MIHWCFSFSEFQHSNVDLIIKKGVSNELLLNAFHQYDVYDNEMEFYAKIVPKFNQKLKELDEPDLIAEPFGVCAEKNILILEDLSVKGYQARSPAHGFNMHETKAVLRRVATFHAICAVLQQEQPDIFANFKKGNIKTKRTTFFGFFLLQNEILFQIPRTHEPWHECIRCHLYIAHRLYCRYHFGMARF